jgi:hypothetical protein
MNHKVEYESYVEIASVYFVDYFNDTVGYAFN